MRGDAFPTVSPWAMMSRPVGTGMMSDAAMTGQSFSTNWPLIFSALVNPCGLWLYHSAMTIPARFLLLLCLLLGGCKEPIRSYRVAAEPETVAPVLTPNEDPPAERRELSVSWTTQPEWEEEKVGQFLTAAYAIPDVGRLTVSKLGGDGGGLAANVNRWRGQINLKPQPESELRGQPMPVKGSERQLLLFSLAPENATAEAEGILAAVLPLGTETWYFKLTGPATKLLDKGATVFTEFLGTVRISGETTLPTPPAAPALPKIQVIAPAGWEPGSVGSMRAASFAIKAADGATADVSVIPLPGNSGSVLDNVNRWRGQIQLPPLSSADDPALGTEMNGTAGKLIVTHMVSEVAVLDGKKAAISAAILRSNGITWFFKITGEASLVEANREKFEEFARSATFP